MKKVLFLLMAGLGTSLASHAQNTFPTPSGYVGIGTNNPRTMLEVAPPPNNPSLPSGLFRLSGHQSWGHVLTLSTDDTNGDDARMLFAYRNGNKRWALGGSNNADHFSLWEDAGDGLYGTGFGTARLTVLPGGNIGIGTMSPSARLHVTGGGLSVGSNIIPNNTDGTLSVGDFNSNYSPDKNNAFNVGTTVMLNALDYSTIGFHDSGNRVDFIRTGNGTIQLGYNGGWGAANIGLPNGVWNSSGFVGIGTTAPQGLLSLKGASSDGMIRLTPNTDNGESSISFNTRSNESDKTNLWAIGTGAWNAGQNFVIGNSAYNGPLMTLNPTGNVGIGTTAPETKLDVNSGGSGFVGRFSSNTNNAFTAVSSTSGNNFMGIESVGAWLGPGSNTALNFKTNNIIRTTITNNGDVGIGTTAPKSKLQVNGAVLFGGGGANIDFQNQNPLHDISFLQGSAQTLVGWNRTAGGGETDFISNQLDNLVGGYAFYNYTNAGAETQLMRMQANGNIGIGTPDPQASLHISKSGNGTTGGRFILQNSSNVAAGNATEISFLTDNGASPTYYNANIRAVEESTANGYTAITFGTYGGFGGPDERMRISSQGNLSIGTTDAKGYKLAVAGNALAESMTVKLQSNWPDYVFKPAYQLPSLTDVKAYIDQHQHLPDLPSEQEVTAQGINLGEMNKLLTKKVEELTLYLIVQDKQMEELKLNQRKQTQELQKNLKSQQQQIAELMILYKNKK